MKDFSTRVNPLRISCPISSPVYIYSDTWVVRFYPHLGCQGPSQHPPLH